MLPMLLLAIVISLSIIIWIRESFSTPVLTGKVSQKFERHQVSRGLQDASQYSSWSQ